MDVDFEGELSELSSSDEDEEEEEEEEIEQSLDPARASPRLSILVNLINLCFDTASRIECSSRTSHIY